VRNLLEEAVVELHLEPGETYRTTVNDIEVQLHRAAAERVPDNGPPEPAGNRTIDPSEDKTSQFADMVMLEPWVDLGAVPPQRVISVTVTRGEPILPAPIIIDESDLAPG
jgi:hypothetical protein